jgi:flagellar motor protein MotB
MFWVKRLKTAEEDVHWSVPYGDLMSLLLAMLVMIATMSELKAGSRYHRMAGGVRAAFGFSEKPTRAAAVATARPVTLIERLEQVARSDAGPARLDLGSDESTAPCEVVREGDRLAMRVPADAAFEPFSGVPKPATDRLLGRLADFVAAGHGSVEVRAFADDGNMPAGAPFRDAWDLSYQRARAAAEVLTRRGVSRDRLCVIAMGNPKVLAGPADPTVRPTPATSPAASAPRSSVRASSLEIVVQAAAGHAQ